MIRHKKQHVIKSEQTQCNLEFVICIQQQVVSSDIATVKRGTKSGRVGNALRR
jgi:hypothetical protein